MSTLALDELMLDYTVNVLKAKSACLGYNPGGNGIPYPRATCISVNNVICHGIPSEKKILKNKRLVDATWGCMWAGIEEVRPGKCFNDIGIACHNFVKPMGLSIVHEYGGHGIGRVFHGEPHVCHVPISTPTAKFEPGMIFTVEPMVNAGKRHIMDLNDGWTVVTKDRSLSAQWELEVVVTETGYDILTVSKGMPEPPTWVKGWKKPSFD